ncbi:MAG TPA: hypothetical protein ENI66_00255 [Candidatus Yonathbacteria bacterium]|nr:hypothetical protein [Candidatus Yonathbacteria bacterium]
MPVKKTKKEKTDKKTLVLLDAHAILHRAYHALPDFSSSSGEPTGALYGVSAMLMKIIRELKPDYIVACYDLPEPTFRHEAYKEYKAGRSKTDDALVSQIKRSRDIFESFSIPIYEKSGFEADDMLGTIVEQVKDNKELNTIIASGDMDTLQLVDKDRVRVYTLKKGINDTIIYNESAVKERFGFAPEFLIDFKGLRGDPSDNIIGIVGIGEKTATSLITQFGTIEDIYKKLKKSEKKFIEAGIKPRIINLLKEGEEEALFSKTLATIRRDSPITFTLPAKTWEESFDRVKAENLFSKFEFRALKERLRELTGDTEKVEDEDKPKEYISEEDIEKLKIATWLVNSELTMPNEEDVLDLTNTDSLIVAKTVLEKRLNEEGVEKVYKEIELPLIPIIAGAQAHGVLVDVEYLKKLSVEYHKDLAKIEKKIWKLAGREFNINSPKQLGEILFDELNLSAKGLKKTASGARSTRESELTKLKDEHEIVSEILSYRELQKLLSTYIDNIPAMVGDDGRLHSQLNQTGTTTGRMSSTNPNMQNIPVREGVGNMIRNAFIAPKGYKLVAFDYSQIEIRVLAELSGDKVLTKTFREGRDVHSAVAARVFGVKESDVTKDMRRKAKVINFGIMYGMGVNALRENLGSDRKEAQEFYNNYFKKFPDIAGFMDSVKADARKYGYTETLFGRKRHFESIKSKLPFIRAAAERMAVNAPVQGTAADIMKIAMKKADEKIKKENISARLIMSVHDELIFEIKEREVDKAVKIIKNAMEDIPKITIPIIVNASVGEKWGDLKTIDV